MAGEGRMDTSRLDMVLVEGFKARGSCEDLTFRQGCGHSEEGDS